MRHVSTITCNEFLQVKLEYTVWTILRLTTYSIFVVIKFSNLGGKCNCVSLKFLSVHSVSPHKIHTVTLRITVAADTA